MTRGRWVGASPHDPSCEWEYTAARPYAPARDAADACWARRDYWHGHLRPVSCASLRGQVSDCQTCPQWHAKAARSGDGGAAHTSGRGAAP